MIGVVQTRREEQTGGTFESFCSARWHSVQAVDADARRRDIRRIEHAPLLLIGSRSLLL